MNSLDKVIEKIESAWVCPSSDEAAEFCGLIEIREDALQYLRWYKELADDSEAFAKWKQNPPLTWDELRTMDGKPVWATFDNENGTWYIAKVYDDEVVLYEWGQEFGERISGTWDYTPKRWQAYRKERV